MTEYITKAQALSAMRKATNCTWDDIWSTEYVLKSVPAADVAPVVHARWERMRRCSDAYGTIKATCQACKTQQRLGDYSDYCPKCGARMDGEGE